MIDTSKVAHLISRLQHLVSAMENKREYVIHRNVNQFYYMQKTEELKLQLEQLGEAQKRLEVIARCLEANYTEVYYQWYKDALWLGAGVMG